ncbi:MAG TPA: protein-L-isoaspartate O-methyltransferase [Methylophaga aminisulfidivorans]|nr:protein-L-isoaspartate O-methyltransferase [Methylophaga aminisulfidivorans]
MVIQQVRPNHVLDDAVLNAMMNLPREHFVDEEYKALAYSDTMLPIGFEQSMLSPTHEGRFLQILGIKQEQSVLEIGTGSGYFTALLATLAKDVISVEYYTELSELAKQRLSAFDIDNVSLIVGDASKGWALGHRIDIIVLTGACVNIPDQLLQQLTINGKLLAVTGYPPAMSVQLVTRITEREWETEILFETVIPYLIHAEPTALFEF